MAAHTFVYALLSSLLVLPGLLHATHVCVRFHLHGPCDLLKIDWPKYKEKPDSMIEQFCHIACEEEECYKYDSICHCTPVTTPPPVCETTYLENIACKTAQAECGYSLTCRKHRYGAQRILASLGEGVCDCPTMQISLPDACDRIKEHNLCESLQYKGIIGPAIPCDCYKPTTPKIELPGVCYYHIQRLGETSRTKRLFSGQDVSPDCEYPGIAGVFVDVGTSSMRSMCTAVLVSEDKILISDTCKAFIQFKPAYVHVKSHKTADVTKEYEIDLSSAEKVADNVVNTLHLVSLKKAVTFDTKCTQPACLPNGLFTVNELDLRNCLVVGYGTTTDQYLGPQKETLQMAEVVVAKDSTAKSTLTVARKDGVQNPVCFEDESAPVMCPHSKTGEIIVVGIATQTGFACSTGELQPALFTNILEEAPKGANHYFSVLKNTKYAKPDNIYS